MGSVPVVLNGGRVWSDVRFFFERVTRTIMLTMKRIKRQNKTQKKQHKESETSVLSFVQTTNTFSSHDFSVVSFNSQDKMSQLLKRKKI